MLNLGDLTRVVQKNCDISDARYAGDFSLCVYLLKMREFYRWEHEIPLDRALSKDAVGAWLDEREHLWDAIESAAFEPLPLDRGELDPFDTAAINHALIPHGCVYSGGYGRFNKPHFFLGALRERQERDGHTLYISTCEYARDLVAPPAMRLGNDIYVRQESVRRFLWERIEETRWAPCNEIMRRALAAYGFESDADAALERMTQNEADTMILHELGEGRAGLLLGAEWEQILAATTRTPAEIALRAIRDLLADCLVTLPRLIERDNVAALHFHFANFIGMRRQLYPRALDAYRCWTGGGDMNEVRAAAAAGADLWLDTARALIDVSRRAGAASGAAIEQWLRQRLPGYAALKH